MNPFNLVPTFQASAEGPQSENAKELAEALLTGKLRTTSSKYRAKGRNSSAPVIVFDKHLSRVCTGIFDRDVRNEAASRGLTVPEDAEERRLFIATLKNDDGSPAVTRETPYAVLSGIYQAKERYTSIANVEEATKFGSQLAKVIGYEEEVTLPMIERWHALCTQDYIETEGASKYIKIGDLTDEAVSDEMGNLDNEMAETAPSA